MITFFFLFVVAAIGGALNSVAGGGSFLTLPALLYAGVTPVAANATSTLAMWPGSVSSAIAYRRELKARMQWLVTLGVVSLVGGLLGAVLLVRTSDTSFMRLLPWLMLLAATTFTFGGQLATVASPRASQPGFFMVALVQFFISVYGGYFGGGMGIMMLATFSLAGHDGHSRDERPQVAARHRDQHAGARRVRDPRHGGLALRPRHDCRALSSAAIGALRRPHR